MKKSLHSALFCGLFLLSCQAFAQSGSGQICFIRPGAYTGAAVNYRVFIDDSLVCKLKNNRYSMHTVPSGEHTVSGQNTGLTLDKGSTPFKVKVEDGKVVYVSVANVSNRVLCQEITQNSATEQLKKSKPSTNCGDKTD